MFAFRANPYKTLRNVWIYKNSPSKFTRLSLIFNFSVKVDNNKSYKVIVSKDDVLGKPKQRLDYFLAKSLMGHVSRSKIQDSIDHGLVHVNGAPNPVTKASVAVRPGDVITCVLRPLESLKALPEPALKLDVIYEDAALLVVNKAPGMVVHSSPGHRSGTLTNAVLGHCMRSDMEGGKRESGVVIEARDRAIDNGGEEADDSEDMEDADMEDLEALQEALKEGSSEAVMDNSHYRAGLNPTILNPNSLIPNLGGACYRPGIAHRLDKGTSGVLVVAKTPMSLERLTQQFHDRTVERIYVSVCVGHMPMAEGVVRTNIIRDPTHRKRMVAVLPYGVESKGRTSISTFRVLECLCGGRAAVVEWRLKTGRTHQIRVHSKHIGAPLFADDTYGGDSSYILKQLIKKQGDSKKYTNGQASLSKTVEQEISSLLVSCKGRPALHALTLGFEHPVSRQKLHFEVPIPEDMRNIIQVLRNLT